MPRGDTLLIDAARRGCVADVVTLLAHGVDVNEANNWGRTPLYVACHWGHTKIVTKLLAANANVDQAEKYGETERAERARGRSARASTIVRHHARDRSPSRAPRASWCARRAR